jgi:adenylate kinase family enzyme
MLAMDSGVSAAIRRDDDATGSPARTVVLVTGTPGAGKTTVSRALSKALTLPLLSKDAIKESLFDVLGVRDREWSLQLGAAANNVLWSLLSQNARRAPSSTCGSIRFVT